MSIRRFSAHDLFLFNNVNLDYFTETVSRCPPRCGRSHAGAVTQLKNPIWPNEPLAMPLQYNLNFYLQYLAKWPEYCLLAEGPGRQSMGYSE